VANRVIFDEDPRAQTDCANWNSRSFFATAGAADVCACLRAGSDPDARDKYDATPFDVIAKELIGTPVYRRLKDARRIRPVRACRRDFVAGFRNGRVSR